jgi:chromosome segregation ATPase
MKIWHWISSRKRLREEIELLREKIKAQEKKEREMQILNVNMKRETDFAIAKQELKHAKKVSSLERSIEQSLNREEQLKQELEEKTRELESRKKELEDKKRELGERKKELERELEEKKQELEEKTWKLERELEDKKRELGERKKALARYSDKMLIAQEDIKKLHHRIMQIEAKDKRKKNR